MRDYTDPRIDLNGRNILVTGGTGSFGTAFVANVVEAFTPERLIIYSRDELKQYEMEHRFPVERYPFMRFFLGDVRDQGRLDMAMRGVDLVVHAAALKHVSAAEYNPFECIQTNVMGAENVVQAAIRSGVERVIALSTDKAANPINLYGASKLVADKIFVAANSLSGRDGPRFAVVRYGNVLGSRGSVVPLFRKFAAITPVVLPITDERMTRFWITLAQGVAFVMSSMAMMQGGEVFVPKIPSTTIIKLARAISPDATFEIIGIKPGEKLHETLISPDDARNTLELDDRYIVMPAFPFWTQEHLSPLGARPVVEFFSYASDTNPETLSGDVLRGLLDLAENE